LVYDIFPENLISAGYIKKNSFIYKITKKIFDWSYSKADNLIVIGRDMEEVISKKVNNMTNIKYIPNWCDTTLIQPLNKQNNKIIIKYQLEDKIVFAFTGNFGNLQGIEFLLDATKYVNSKKFILLFIGDGAKKELIIQYIKKNKKQNIIYDGNYPSSEQNLFLNACDVSIVSLTKDMYGLGVPSKSYYNMAAEKPILYIGDKLSEIGRVIDETHNGWIVDSNSSVTLALKIDDICNGNSIIKRGKRSRELMLKQYNKDIILKQYKEYL
jgi:hypothetical protein